MAFYEYLSNSEEPSIPLRWLTNAGAVIDLSAATWTVKLIVDGTVILSKTSGVTGYSTLQGTAPNDYNCLIVWAAGDLATSGLSGHVFTARSGTLVVQHTIANRQSEPFKGDLGMSVTAAPS